MSAVGATLGYLLIVLDSDGPFYRSPQSVVGTGLITVSAVLLPTTLYFFNKYDKIYRRESKRLEQNHKKTLQAIDQRNQIAASKREHNPTGQTFSEQETKELKLKQPPPLSDHQKAWLALGAGSLVIASGYRTYQDDPNKSKTPLYLGVGLGSALVLSSVYFFGRVYAEYTRAEQGQSLGIDNQSRSMNAWVAPSLIDQDWALSMGFLF